jgi:hypothetical protein
MPQRLRRCALGRDEYFHHTGMRGEIEMQNFAPTMF